VNCVVICKSEDSVANKPSYQNSVSGCYDMTAGVISAELDNCIVDCRLLLVGGRSRWNISGVTLYKR
jgi:hypothetical protein